MTFHVGQKVVCVNDGDWHPDFLRIAPRLPVQGRVYTIRAIDNNFYERHVKNLVGIHLAELVNPIVRLIYEGDIWNGEPAFVPARFRPLTDTKTEVSFTVGADPETEQFDNRRKSPAKVGV